MARLYANNRATTLAAPLAASAAAQTVTITNGSAFPEITGADTFYVTLDDGAGTYEILQVTAHSAGGTTLTVDRGQDGTTPLAWNIGDLIEMRVVAQEYREFLAGTDAANTLEGDLTIEGTLVLSNTPLAVASGGTGVASLTDDSLLVGAGTGAVEGLAAGTAGDVVYTADGTTWSSTPITTAVTKAVVDNALSATPLGVPEGGTGAVSFPSGNLIVGNGVGALQSIPAGSIGSLATTRFRRKVHIFTTPGTFFVNPVTGADLRIVVGGGGGGGGGGGAGYKDETAFGSFLTRGGSGGDGGGGAISQGWYTSAPSGVQLTATVGAGGAGGAGSAAPLYTIAAGSSGTGSTLTSSVAYATMEASGGAGGAAGANATAGSHGADGADGARGATVVGDTASPTMGDYVPPAEHAAEPSVGSSGSGLTVDGRPVRVTGGGGAGGVGGLGETSNTVRDSGTAGADGEDGIIIIEEYY